MKLFCFLLMMILVQWTQSYENNATLFEIHPHSWLCTEGVNLYLTILNDEIPCVKCQGGGNLKTDGSRLFCENQAAGFCFDQPTYFAMMLGDFPLCVRRRWWYGEFPYDDNAHDVYSTYRDFKNN